MVVEVIIEDERWAEAGIEALARRAIDAALAHLGLDPGDWEVAVLGCDDDRIAALNADFRGKPRPTNVLSWPSEERGATDEGARPRPPSGDPGLGDIALAFETCTDEATASGRSFGEHAVHLLVHGCLHLLGYDHVRDGDGDLMEATETAILAKLGVPDPYA